MAIASLVTAALLAVLAAAQTSSAPQRPNIPLGLDVYMGCGTVTVRGPRVRGLQQDGHLGLWGALAEIFPEADEQRCWNHKILNVLDRFPKRLRDRAKALLCQIPYAETEAKAVRLRKRFAEQFGADFPKAVEIIESDWERMVTFYRYPKGHWPHLRTTNVVESPFAAVRLRTTAAKRYKKVSSATAMIWKLLLVAEKNFRRLKARHLLPEVADGAEYKDGVRIARRPESYAA
ncbi:MAG: transposase [Acidobacteria bacterium]|nr:transposase [Acidobacteriota bacterium]